MTESAAMPTNPFPPEHAGLVELYEQYRRIADAGFSEDQAFELFMEFIVYPATRGGSR